MVKLSAQILLPIFILATLLGQLDIPCCCYMGHDFQVSQKSLKTCCKNESSSAPSKNVGLNTAHTSITGTCNCGLSNFSIGVSEESIQRIAYQKNSFGFDSIFVQSAPQNIRAMSITSNDMVRISNSRFDVIYQKFCSLRI